MKSERRRKLERNDLAGWLENFFEKTKEYHTAILYTICGIILLVVVVNIYFLVSKAGQKKQWDAYQVAVNTEDPAELSAFAEKNATSCAGALASLQVGRNALDEALVYIQINDKEKALESLASAKDAFKRVERYSQPDFRQQALWGQASVCEALATIEKTEENLAEAVKNYEKVVELGGVTAEKAKEILLVLKKAEAKDLFVAYVNRADADSADAAMDQIQSGFAEPELDLVESPELPEVLPPVEAEAAPAETPAPAAEAAPVETPAPAAETAPVETPAPATEAAPAE